MKSEKCCRPGTSVVFILQELTGIKSVIIVNQFPLCCRVITTSQFKWWGNGANSVYAVIELLPFWRQRHETENEGWISQH